LECLIDQGVGPKAIALEINSDLHGLMLLLCKTVKTMEEYKVLCIKDKLLTF